MAAADRLWTRLDELMREGLLESRGGYRGEESRQAQQEMLFNTRDWIVQELRAVENGFEALGDAAGKDGTQTAERLASAYLCLSGRNNLRIGLAQAYMLIIQVTTVLLYFIVVRKPAFKACLR
ncbi:hypothetical protein CRG98_032836 [Punica granatum]|uniref:Uncharacterized protein n=1 Tax=Punica granatum TaxID=22663 RepID=A0A2I0IS10_PUNGR|nr:hypothetical protein CRG98_032836 [Punica granatum]